MRALSRADLRGGQDDDQQRDAVGQGSIQAQRRQKLRELDVEQRPDDRAPHGAHPPMIGIEPAGRMPNVRLNESEFTDPAEGEEHRRRGRRMPTQRRRWRLRSAECGYRVPG